MMYDWLFLQNALCGQGILKGALSGGDATYCFNGLKDC